MLVDDRSFWARTPQGRTGCEDQVQIFIRLFVLQNPLCDLQQAAEFDQRRRTGTRGSLENHLPCSAKAQAAEPCLVGDAQEIICLAQRANGAVFTRSLPALGALHQPAAPCVGGRIANRAEHRLATRGCKWPAAETKRRLNREPACVPQPCFIILECHRLGTARRMPAQQAERAAFSRQVDMDFDIRHCGSPAGRGARAWRNRARCGRSAVASAWPTLSWLGSATSPRASSRPRA